MKRVLETYQPPSYEREYIELTQEEHDKLLEIVRSIKWNPDYLPTRLITMRIDTDKGGERFFNIRIEGKQ